MFGRYYGFLKDAVKEGTGAKIEQLKVGAATFEMTKNLTTNVGVFSAFKNHEHTAEVVAALRDENGNMVNFPAFAAKVKPISEKYNQTWLQTEYDSAVRTSRLASQWENIQSTKHLYPNLKYIVSRSTIKREEHLSLVGTVLPIDDPFWDKYYPPNGWNCKCSVRKTDEPVSEPGTQPKLLPEFSFNPGKDGQVFNVEASGYAKELKPTVRKRVLDQASKAIWNFEKNDFNTFAQDKLIGNNFKVGKRELQVKEIDEANLINDEFFFERLAVLRNLDSLPKDGEWTEKGYVVKIENKTITLKVEEIEGKYELKIIDIQ